MRILVVGAGAVGSVLGGSLLRSGHEVVFGARAETAASLRNKGMRIEWPSETWSFEHLQVKTPEDKIENFDHLLFCVKGYDWQSAAAQFIDRFPAKFILTFQNGVSIHHELAKKSTRRVLGSVIYVSADRVEPGVVKSKSLSRVVLDGSPDVRSEMEALQSALSNSNLTALLSENIEKDLWRKYLFLCTFSGLNTLTARPLAAILNEPLAVDLWKSYMREMISVAQKSGVLFEDSEIETVLENAAKFPPNTSSSLFADTLRGQNTEVELLQGYLVRLAAQLALHVPISDTIYSLLKVRTLPQ
jgi:2-dehydropantoate 2-reductase